MTTNFRSKKFWLLAIPVLAALMLLPRAMETLSADYWGGSYMYNDYGTGNNNAYAANQMTVSIQDDFFSPQNLTVTAGTRVTWTNNGSMAHTVTADDGSFDSGRLDPGQSFSWTFNSSGTVPYHCSFHGGYGGVGMSGTVNIGNNNNYNYNNNGNNYVSPVSGSFSLSSNNNYCVNQSPTYSISAPGSWGSQNIQWTSTHNGQINVQNTYSLNSSGSWSATGSTWQNSDIGSWTKTAVINGQTQTLNFTVQSCGAGSGNNNGYNGFGGSVGNSSDPSIGGSVGSSADPSIGGNVGNSSNPSLGGSVNGNPPGSYIDSNGYLCRPPGQ